MKILASIIAALLVLLLIGGGIYFLIQNQAKAPPSSSQSVAVSKVTEQKAPTSVFKVPQALEQAIKSNEDTVAWITVPGTDINNSVLQADDNNYYLRRNESKQDEVYGCYFADYECSVGAREVLEPNTVIYGHSTPGDDPDGKRFSQLFRYNNPEFAKANPVIHLATTDERLTFEIFAVFYTLTDFDYIRVQISNDEMRTITQKAEELSIYDYAAEITPEDKILTLSTCSELFDKNGNGRYVVMARLLPEGAEEPAEAQFTVK